MADPYKEEIDRLAKLLFELAQKKRYSMRSLEKKMGVATGRFRVALKKPGGLSLKLLLMLLDAMEMGRGDFFRLAYPQDVFDLETLGPAGPKSPEDSRKAALRRLLGEVVLEMLGEKAGSPPEGKT